MTVHDAIVAGDYSSMLQQLQQGIQPTTEDLITAIEKQPEGEHNYLQTLLEYGAPPDEHCLASAIKLKLYGETEQLLLKWHHSYH